MIINVSRILKNHDLSIPHENYPNGNYLLIDSVYTGIDKNYDGPWTVYNGMWTRPVEWQIVSPDIPNCRIQVENSDEGYELAAQNTATGIVCYCNSAEAMSHVRYQYVLNLSVSNLQIHNSDVTTWDWVTFAIADEVEVTRNTALAPGKYLLMNAYRQFQTDKCSGIWYKYTDGSFVRDVHLRPDSTVQVYQGIHAGNIYRVRYTETQPHNATIETLHIAWQTPVIVRHVVTDDTKGYKQPVLSSGCVYGPGMSFTYHSYNVGDNIFQNSDTTQNLLVVEHDNDLRLHPLCQNGAWCGIDTQLLVINPFSPYHGHRWYCGNTVANVSATDRPLWRMQTPQYDIQPHYDYVVTGTIDVADLCFRLLYKTAWPLESEALWSSSAYLSTPKNTPLDGSVLRIWHETSGPWQILMRENDITFSRPPFYNHVHDVGAVLLPVTIYCTSQRKRIIYFRNVHRLPADKTEWLYMQHVPNSVVTNKLTVTGTELSDDVDSGSLVVRGGAGINGNVYCRSVFIQSDRVLKRAIQPIASVMPLIRALRPKRYDMTNRKACAGLIAQEVHALAPELIETDHNGMLCVDYMAFIPYIIKAIQLLDRRIKKKKRRVISKT